MYKKVFLILAFVAFAMGLVLTGLGGWMDGLRTQFVLTKEHAWNDGFTMILVAIFLLVAAVV